MSDNGKPVASAQFAMWKQHPKVYAEPTHEDWLHENDRLRSQLADTQRKLEEDEDFLWRIAEIGYHGKESGMGWSKVSDEVSEAIKQRAIEQSKGGDDEKP